jgi:hypothetical protein
VPGTRATEILAPPRISLAPSTRSEIQDENRSLILLITIVPKARSARAMSRPGNKTTSKTPSTHKGE